MLCPQTLQISYHPQSNRNVMNMKENSEMDEEGNPFFQKKSEIDIEETLHRFIEKIKRLQKERTELIREIEQLGEEAEREAKELEREVSMLKQQAMSLNEVLRTMHTHRKRI